MTTTAKIIDGKLLAKSVCDQLRADVLQLKEKNVVPHLSIIQVGEREDSNVYVRMKQSAAEKVGIHFSHHNFGATTTETELLAAIDKLNKDNSIHGILVQLPLPEGIDEKVITDAVDSRKDVDGFHSLNIGLLAKRNHEPFFEPCTPKGCIELLKHAGVEIEGNHAVVIGRSNIVGIPVAHLLLTENATVTICHLRSKNLQEMVKSADILITAMGSPEAIKGSWIKPGAVVIDVGINSIPDSTRKSGVRLVGDVEFESASQVASAITPVPGGVGPMTVAMLMHNTVLSAKRFVERS
ncbi:tetrahydrofolate dehydrogenase/cyclohydrolase [Phlyctochytrium arcticum]|nr:tetrahydrofolate dehydrogenase/cyclohydrolase [Phlyctochytrium arcticum]